MKHNSNLTRLTIRFYWDAARKYPRNIIGVMISSPLTILVGQYLPPLIVADALNRLSTHDFQPNHVWSSFGTQILAFATVSILGGVVGWRLVDYFTWRLEGKVLTDIARRVFNHLLIQSPSFHADHFGGSLVSQTNKLSASYVRFADTTAYQMIPLVSSLVFAAIILGKRAPLFVILLIAFAFLYMISAIFVTKPVRRWSGKMAAAESSQTGNLSDSITNIMAIKSFAQESHERARFATATDKTRDYLMQVMHAHAKSQIYFGALTNVIATVAFVMAIVGVVVFDANIGTVFLILSYTNSIVGQLFQFSNSSLKTYNRALGDASDMVAILQIEPAIKDPEHPEVPRISKGSVQFSDVTFSHDGQDDALFEHLNLEIQAGEKVGLVGHSGSGKTTFTRLLLRFSDIDSGKILIDGQNIRNITQHDLRQNISYVPQEPLLFHRSLRENIRYGHLDASDKAVEAVAKLAHAHDFVQDLPKKYNTLVGERGVKLSGGQRQRVAIARAMLHDAPILLLDEATSALDSESEVLIQDALWKLMEGKTAIVIAHRLSTIQKMDRIIVLDGGKIVEQGSHKELLRNDGTYAKLWAHQSGGFIED